MDWGGGVILLAVEETDKFEFPVAFQDVWGKGHKETQGKGKDAI